MENNTTRIWQYLDGEMKAEERLLFEQSLKKDAALQAEYQHLLKFNTQLANMPLKKAPPSMVDNVFDKLKPKPSYLSKYNSFFGLNIIIGGILVVGALISIMLLSAIDMSSVEMPSYIESFKNIFSGEILTGVSRQTILTCSMVAISLFFLIWLDQFIQSNRMHNAYFKNLGV